MAVASETYKPYKAAFFLFSIDIIIVLQLSFSSITTAVDNCCWDDDLLPIFDEYTDDEYGWLKVWSSSRLETFIVVEGIVLKEVDSLINVNSTNMKRTMKW